MNSDTTIQSSLPFPCFTAGVRGFNCPGLKLHGYYTLRQLERDGKKKLALGREKLAAQGIFLPAPVKNGWPTTEQLEAESTALEAARNPANWTHVPTT